MAKASAFEKVGESLYRYRSNGTFYARIKHQGREIFRSLRTPDRPLAKRRLALLVRGLVDNGKVGDPAEASPPLALSALLDRYLETCAHQAPKTLVRKRYIARCLKADWPHGAEQPIQQIVRSDIARWLSSYGFGPASYNLFREFMLAALRLAVQDRLLGVSPAEGIPARRRERPIRLTPRLKEFEAILADVRGQRCSSHAHESANFLEFLGRAGVGQAEAAGLQWQHVDFAAGRITLFRKKTRQGFTIPLYPGLRPVLERLRDQSQRSNRSPGGATPVFRVRDAKKALLQSCNRLRVGPFTPRSLRRMFITRALQEGGIDVQTIASWQGHRDGGKLILDTYSHVVASHSDEMAKRMT